MKWSGILGLCVGMLAMSGTAAAQPYVYEPVAREFVGGLGFLAPSVRPALAPDGKVAFVGSAPGSFEAQNPRLFVSSGAPASLVQVDLTAAGYTLPHAVQVDGSGRVVFDSSRTSRSTTYRGFYRTSVSGGAISTIYESSTQPLWQYHFGLSPNGTVAFATLENGMGAIMRGVLPAAPTVLRAGSGTFYNSSELDVNDAGQVPVRMEYTDPTAGLTRGILIFSSPGQALADIEAAIGRAGIGFNASFAINSTGVVAFAINGSITLNFYDPPNVFTPVPASVITLGPGVYTAEPAPFGEPSVFTNIADASGDYSTFGKVSINDAGVVVFEAELDTPYKFGIYRGANPATSKIVQQGDVIDGALFSWIKLGELNNAGQLTYLTSDFYSTDRQVWRVSGIAPTRRIRPLPWPLERWLRPWLPRK